MPLTNTHSFKSFGGWTKHYSHGSKTLNCDMRFAIYLPPQTTNGSKVPVLYWLSGLTCNDENFMHKAGAQRIAAELGVAIVAPDTSPRGEDVADDDSYDLGQGAGFYVNATKAPWNRHYRMYDYILNELPDLIETTFPVSQNRSIFGHSMGGHGALVLALRNPERFQSVSAFSPISNPVKCPWGVKAFTAYLGDEREEWANYDASLLMRPPPSSVRAAAITRNTASSSDGSTSDPRSCAKAANAASVGAKTVRSASGADNASPNPAAFTARARMLKSSDDVTVVAIFFTIFGIFCSPYFRSVKGYAY